MNRENKKICIYCGENNPTTKDHIPPKGLFANPRPSNLLTVPCCSTCHDKTSKDDEYFRDMLSMCISTFNHPDVQGILPKVFRALAKPNKIKSTKAFIETIGLQEYKTMSGIYHTYGVDIFRLDKVVERTVKGLYYHERGVIFPFTGTVKCYLVKALENIDAFNATVAKAKAGSERIIGNDTFKYKMSQGDEPFLEVWLLTFYEVVEFLVILIPAEKE
jgi:hypothetical protein